MIGGGSIVVEVEEVVEVVLLGQAQWPKGFSSMVQLEESNIKSGLFFISSFYTMDIRNSYTTTH